MIDYNGIRDNVVSIIQAGTYTDSIVEFFTEGMERDFLLGNMPFVNVRMDQVLIQPRSLPDGYYAYIRYKIDIAVMDFTEFKKAAIIRDRIMKEVQLVLQANRVFGVGVETSSIGPNVDFSTGIVEENDIQKGHVATATFDFVVEAFIEPA